jgi:hypothetical protein
MIAQGVDAITDAIGRARTDSSRRPYAVSPTPVGETTGHGLLRLGNLDAQHFDRVRQYSDQVFDINQYNRDLAMKEMEAGLDADRSMTERELDDIESDLGRADHYRRIDRRETGLTDREALRAGARRHETDMRYGQEGEQPADQDRLSPRERHMIRQYHDYMQQASPEDYELDRSGSRRVKEGTPTWHAEQLRGFLGEKLYYPEATPQPARHTRDMRDPLSGQVNQPQVLRPEHYPVQNEVEASRLVNENRQNLQRLQQGQFESQEQAMQAVDQVRTNLKRMNFSDSEIEDFFREMFQGQPESRAPATDPGQQLPEPVRHMQSSLQQIRQEQQRHQRILDSDASPEVKQRAESELDLLRQRENYFRGTLQDRGYDEERLETFDQDRQAPEGRESINEQSEAVRSIPRWLRPTYNQLADIDRIKKINQRILDGDYDESLKAQSRRELQKQQEREEQILNRMTRLDSEIIENLEKALGRDLRPLLTGN